MARTKRVPDESLWSGADVTPLPRSKVQPQSAEDVAAQIQGIVISQNLSDGERLPSERDLARMLSTSRPTLRQAIRMLVVKGLIQSQRGSGTYVSRRPHESLAASVHLMLDLDVDSVHHLNDLRLWLETMGIVEAIEKGSIDEVAETEAALGVLQESTGDISAWMSADTHFHSTIVRAAHNPFLTSIFESVHTTLIEYEYRAWVDRGTVPKWLRNREAAAVTAIHEPMLRAFKTRDEEAARIAVLHHHYVMAQHLTQSQSPVLNGKRQAVAPNGVTRRRSTAPAAPKKSAAKH